MDIMLTETDFPVGGRGVSPGRRAGLRARKGPSGGDPIAVGEQILDLDVEIREGGDHADQLLEGREVRVRHRQIGVVVHVIRRADLVEPAEFVVTGGVEPPLNDRLVLLRHSHPPF